MEMTAQALKDICKEHKLYRTPHLNDKLYCNFKGFTNLANLEPYTGLKALFLEGNAIDSLQGLPPLKELRCLYLQQNVLADTDGLQDQTALDTLNISSNLITKICNLAPCAELHTLICTNNKLASYESIEHLKLCRELTTIDLQNNQLEDPSIVEIFQGLPNLRCLYLKGNPAVSKIKNYRKTMIATIPTLTYLDDRPVFDVERRCAEAWYQGGLESERAERQKCKEEEADRDRRNFQYLQNIREEGFRKRRAQLGKADGVEDPFFDDLDNEESQFEQDPPELVEARQRLAAFTARAGEEEPPELSQARRQHAAKGGAVQEVPWQPVLLESDAANENKEPNVSSQADKQPAAKGKIVGNTNEALFAGGVHVVESVVRQTGSDMNDLD